MNNNKLIGLLAALILAACSNTSIQPHSEGSVLAQQADNVKQWQCEGDINGQWHCSDLSRADGKIYSTSAPEPLPRPQPNSNNDQQTTQVLTKNLTAENQQTIDLPPETTINTSSKVANSNPLNDYPDNYFAVQLMAAKKTNSIEKYKQSHPDLAGMELIIEQNNDHLYILILGVYPDYASAKSAVAALIPTPKIAPWIRPVGPLKRLLKQP